MLSALLFSNTAVYADSVVEGEQPSNEVVSETGNTDSLSSTTSSNSSNNLNDTVSGTDITEDSNSNTTIENTDDSSERTVSLDLSNDSSETLDMAAMLSESKVEKKQEKSEEEKKKEEEEKKKKEEEERQAHAWDCYWGNHTWEKQDELHTFTWRDGVHYHEDVYKCKYCSEVKYENRQRCTFEGDFEYDPCFSNELRDGKFYHIESRACTVCNEQKETQYVECTGTTFTYESNGSHTHKATGTCSVCGNEFHFTEECNFVPVSGNENLKRCDKAGCLNFEDCRNTTPEITVAPSLVAGGEGTYDEDIQCIIFDEQMQIEITAKIEALNDETLADVKDALYAELCVTSNNHSESIKIAPTSFKNGVAVFNWTSAETYSNTAYISGVRVEYSLGEKLKDGSRSGINRSGNNSQALNYILRNVSEECAVSGFSSKVTGGKGFVLNENNINNKWYSKSVKGEDLTITYTGKTTSPVNANTATITEVDASGKAISSAIKATVSTEAKREIVGYWFIFPIVDVVYKNTIQAVVPANVDGEHIYRVTFDVHGYKYHSEDIRTYIDNTAPSFKTPAYKSDADRLNGKYYKKDVETSVKVSDANLSTCSYIEVSGQKSYLQAGEDKISLNVTGEGVHKLTGTIYDLAGNGTAITGESEFIIDKTAPTFEEPVYTSGAEKLNGKYYNKDVVVSVKVADLYLDQKSYIEVSGNKASLKADTDTIKLNVAGEGEHKLTGMIYDLAGNCTEIKNQDEFIIDKTAPKLKITFDNHNFKNEKYYNAARTATFVLTDKYIDDKEANMNLVTVNAKEGAATVNKMTGSNGKYTGTIEFKQDGFYSIGEIKFVDKAGNPFEFADDSDSAYNKEFVIDKTAPTVKVSFDNHDVKHEKYYKADRTATFVFEDRNIDSREATMSKVQIIAKEGSATVHEMTGSNGKYTGSIVFDKDGIYSIGELTFEDKAGNKYVFAEGNEDGYNAEFVIDKTVPVIDVDFDNNSSLNGNYFKAARKAELTFTEKNFTADQVTITKNSAEQNAVPAVKGYSSSDLKNVTHILFDTDGRYGFNIVVEDKAGNLSEKYVSEDFVIDMTLPELEISGVEDMSANNGKVAPVVVSKDTNLTDACTEISLVGSNRGKVSPSITKTSGTEQFTYAFADMAHDKENDDLYTLSVKLTDLAGNTVEKTVKYSLNRHGSIFVLSDATKAMVDGYYVTKPQDVVITEINVDAVTKKEVSVAFDGSVKELREGASFTTDDKTNSNGWHSISYNVGKANFNKDGIYSVTVFSEDRATNKQSNQSKDAQVEFLLDKTAPSVIVSGLEDGGIYEEESHDFSVNVTDTIGVTDMKVYLNDEKLASFTAAELNENGGTEVLTIPTKDDYQKVTIQSTDVAGNVTKVEYNNLLVSVKAEELLLEDNLTPTAKLDAGMPAVAAALRSTKTLAVVGVIAVAALVLAGAFAFKKRKH
ncbi:Ig-like domain-containing protein [Butyrivibrio fibrisolvens]|uniref:Ig-like domain-containing protein n=1 Tax=Pseudobutyrivibrio ruminis TaxID=46206 RepID=UPI000427B153|nr:Ig-like domain-containing protein [Pseudobutyrivibrio ruminis]MDC7280695.1 Ig-like domain-containing protein [Butyrivibrio fibrisolvens]